MMQLYKIIFNLAYLIQVIVNNLLQDLNKNVNLHIKWPVPGVSKRMKRPITPELLHLDG